VASPSLSLRPKTSWSWAFLGAVLGLAAGVLLFAPARWLADSVTERSGGRILLSEPRGTIWNGSAEVVLTGGSGSADMAGLPTRVDWRLRPRWNGIRADLSSACCMPTPLTVRTALRWGGTHLAISDSQSHWPAALLSGLGTPWNTLQLDGELQLQTRGLSVEWVSGRLAIAGQAELTAQRLSSRLSTLRPMGSYRITVLGGQTPNLQLQTLDGALHLSGSGTWVGSRLRFSGEATAAADSESALSNLLNIIGRRSGARSIITIG
jgi:general secretion pathway protein N